MSMWTAKDVQEYLRLGRTTVHDLARRTSDPLPHYRFGGAVRFEPAEVQAWKKRQSNTKGAA